MGQPGASYSRFPYPSVPASWGGVGTAATCSYACRHPQAARWVTVTGQGCTARKWAQQPAVHLKTHRAGRRAQFGNLKKQHYPNSLREEIVKLGGQ